MAGAIKARYLMRAQSLIQESLARRREAFGHLRNGGCQGDAKRNETERYDNATTRILLR